MTLGPHRREQAVGERSRVQAASEIVTAFVFFDRFWQRSSAATMTRRSPSMVRVVPNRALTTGGAVGEFRHERGLKVSVAKSQSGTTPEGGRVFETLRL
jgi:hypothetical protein